VNGDVLHQKRFPYPQLLPAEEHFCVEGTFAAGAIATPVVRNVLAAVVWPRQVPTANNNVLLVKIEGPVWYTIYNHLPVVKGVNKPLY